MPLHFSRRFLALFAIFLALVFTATIAFNQPVAAQPIAPDREPKPTWRDYPLGGEPDRAANVSVTQALCSGGNAGGYPCDNIDLGALLPISAIGGVGAAESADLWGWTDPATGNEFALASLTTGTAFVRVTNPAAPVYLGFLPTQTIDSPWRDVKVFDHFALIVSEAPDHGMQVFDLHTLRAVSSPQVFSADSHYTDFGNAHNIVVNEATGFAYAVGTDDCNGGLHIINVQNPLAPTFSGCYQSDFYTHDAQCILYNGPDLGYIGREICLASNEDTVTIVDVTDKANPVQLSRAAYPDDQYTHQGWITEDHAYFLFDDEFDEINLGANTRTHILDLADLNAPVYNGFYEHATPASDHNLYIRGGHLFAANYRAGVRILSLDDLANGNLTEVGFFDVYPTDDNPGFNGAWTVFPYFDSDTMLVSGIEQGLFVLDPTVAPDFRFEPDAVTLTACANGSASTTFDVESLYGFNNSVSMSLTGLPTAATGTFSPATVGPDQSTTLTINSNAAAAGNYRLDITASSGTLSYDEYLRLSIFGEPAPLSLIAGTTDVNLRPTFSWTNFGGATYELTVAKDETFFDIVIMEAGLTQSTYTPAQPLDPDTTYYWRVRAIHPACGTASLMTPQAFTTTYHTLLCNGPAATFEDGIPGDWTTRDNGSIFWTTTDDALGCGFGNEIVGGSGEAACAAYTAANSAAAPAYDVELETRKFELPVYYEEAFLDFDAYFRYFDTSQFDVDIFVPTLGTWVNLANWTEDTNESTTVDLSAYITQSNLRVRYRYTGDGWDWYSQVDNVALTCLGYFLDVAAADQAQSAPIGTTVTYNIVITNSGDYADSYAIRILDEQWPTNTTPPMADPFTVGPLQPGESITLPITVVVADDGSDTARIRIVSNGRPAVSDEVLLTTSSATITVWMPLVVSP